MDNLEGYKLELVQVLFRHGARTNSKPEILQLMPTYVDRALHETYGYEQLTNMGKAQMHKFGCLLRDRYADFLDAVYRPDDLRAYSSDHDRTKMSLQLVLAGLYPPVAEQIWNPSLSWQPIPFHYVDNERDKLLKGMDSPKYRQLLMEIWNSPEIEEEKKNVLKLSPFFEEKGIYAIKEKTFIGCMLIYNVLAAHKAANMRLPDWYTDELFETLQEHVTRFLDILSLTKEMRQINVGFLIKELIENMIIEKEDVNPRKFYLYSGHELNIAAFVRAHCIEGTEYPGYGSAIVLEKLRNSENQLYVRMLTWPGYGDTFNVLKLKDFEEFCPLNEYLTIVKSVIPQDEETQTADNEAGPKASNIFISDYFQKPPCHS